MQLKSAATLEKLTDVINATIKTKIHSKFSLANDFPLILSTCLQDLGMDSLVAVDLRQ